MNSSGIFDVFLSHNSKDKPAVRELAVALDKRGLRSWLDERELIPGRSWISSLDKTIQSVRSAAVLYGPAGLGPWEEPEMEACLIEFVNRKLPVIPVLLPGAPEKPELPIFLRALTWVDLRNGLSEAGLEKLVWGIRGRKSSDEPEGPDIFLSYAREELDWVRKYVYQPLMNCMIGGRRPEVFFDQSVKHDARLALKSVHACRKFIPIVSQLYFTQEYTLWEQGKAFDRDPYNKQELIIPVCRSAESRQSEDYELLLGVPEVMANRTDWWKELQDRLGLEAAAPRNIEIGPVPDSVGPYETIPPVIVTVDQREEGVEEEVTLELDDEHAVLSGNLKVTTKSGVAKFHFLSIGQKTDKTRFTASVAGGEVGHSKAFNVKEAASVLPDQDNGTSNESATCDISVAGQPYFLSDGKSLAVVSLGNNLHVYGHDGASQLADEGIHIEDRVRIIRFSGNTLVLADWACNVYTVDNNGGQKIHSFADASRTLSVIGAIDIADGMVYVGLWSGEVYRFSLQDEPQLVYRHADGVQRLVVLNDRVYICDLSGKLICAERHVGAGSLRKVAEVDLESRVHCIRAFPDSLLVVAQNRLFQTPLDLAKVLDEESSIGPIAAAFGDTDFPVIVGPQGNGIRVDSELNIRTSFHTVGGALPVSADSAGTRCIFRNPDGTHTLMVREQTAQGSIIYTHVGVALAISPNGDRLALARENGISIVDVQTLQTSGRGGNRDAD